MQSFVFWKSGWSALRSRRHGAVVVFVGVFLVLSFATRVMLLLKAQADVAWDASLAAALAWGALFDLATAAWLALPVIVALTVLPRRFFAGRFGRWSVAMTGWVVLAAFLFLGAAEWLFWDEFGARFNFIAVDYLIYTQEVLGNIRESYPVPLILTAVGVGALGLAALLWYAAGGRRWAETSCEPWRRRYRTGGIAVVLVLLLGGTVDADWLPEFANNYNREIAKNGVWSFVAAFRDNQLEYDRFYNTLPVAETFRRLHHELEEDGSVPLWGEQPDTLRFVRNEGPELHPNIIQITVESLSADFLGYFNRASRLTPNLTALAERSLVFENLYATGTRTDRGMEALTLSLPPTPGRSLIKRPHNENLFTFGSVLRTRGYDTAFLYGGFGYFDNMNYFFGHNGYRVVDRASVSDDDITFANAWGACDEDLLRWTTREADAAASAGRPFHFFVMTTSNHRPYTYPEGRIDLPPKISGRAGAVKYTDYAIGQFLHDAESRPWFKNTIFVIVADHCASSAGKTELPVKNYHIPMIIYAPGGQIAAGRVPTLMSQMDYAPTLLGLLGWSYPSRFFGHDVRRIEPDDAHALIATYQKLGHLENGEFVVLRPVRGQSFYRLNPDTMALSGAPPSEYAENEAIAFYGGASYMCRNGLYRALTAEEERRFSQVGFARTAPAAAALARRP